MTENETEETSVPVDQEPEEVEETQCLDEGVEPQGNTICRMMSA